VRTEFRAALKRGFGIHSYQKIDSLVKEIKSLDFSTADNYQQSVLSLVKYLSSEYQLHLDSPTLSEPFSKFSEEDINAWVKHEIVETEPWP
ncbi:MAG TPA: hypothetical protein VMT73_08780, partial [Anaerolineales bacterium]|nr:hypothetical protein [Anaerolineales bacterium]